MSTTLEPVSVRTRNTLPGRGGSPAQLDRVRLLKFLTLFGFGGTERQVANLARMLDRSRFDVRFACLKRWGHFLEEIEQCHIPVNEYRISSLRELNALGQQFRFAADLRRQRVQIVHTYNFYANVFAVPAARLAGTPVVVASVRDTGVYLTPAQMRVQSWIIRLADCILVNAGAVRQWLVQQGCDANRIRIIHNGIDTTRFGRKVDTAALRQGLGLPKDAPLAIVMARLNPQKGIEYFLEAAAIIRRRHPEVRFLVVGAEYVGRNGAVERELEYQQSLERKAARLDLAGRVIFTGFRSDIPELLATTAVSVLPSLSEGLSNTLLESMAAGVPVVATRVGGNPEIIEDQRSGLLVPPRDPVALAEAMCAVLGNSTLACSLGAEGRRRVAACFSLERMVLETEALYLNLLREKSRAPLRHSRAGKAQEESLP